MANESSRSKLIESCPHYVKEVNESLHILHAPVGDPEVDIMFFHGLQLGNYKDAFWKTWLSRDGTKLWPRDWLAKSFPAARILSASYNSCATKTSSEEDDDLHNIGENLLNNVILMTGQADVGQNRPVVLVGHSLGGIAIKKLMARDKKHAINREKYAEQGARVDEFLNNLRGVFYYATPHGGSGLADSAISFLRFPLPFLHTRDTVHVLTTLNRNTRRINEDFREWREQSKCLATSVMESLPAKIFLFRRKIIVKQASAAEDSDNKITANADHYNVCKPESMTDSSYQVLCDFIRRIATPERAITYISADAQQDNTSLM